MPASARPRSLTVSMGRPRGIRPIPPDDDEHYVYAIALTLLTPERTALTLARIPMQDGKCTSCRSCARRRTGPAVEAIHRLRKRGQGRMLFLRGNDNSLNKLTRSRTLRWRKRQMRLLNRCPPMRPNSCVLSRPSKMFEERSGDRGAGSLSEQLARLPMRWRQQR